MVTLRPPAGVPDDIDTNSATLAEHVTAPEVRSPAGVLGRLLSRVANGVAAVAHVIDTSEDLSDAAAKLLSIRRAGVEKAFFTKDGGLTVGGSVLPLASASLALGSTTRIWNDLFIFQIRDADNRMRFSAQGNQVSIHRSACPNSAGAVGHSFRQAVTITNSAAKLASWFSDDGATERSSISPEGEYECTTAGKGIILKSPDGTRYRLTVADGGTLSIGAA
jgi:hypothetical protein